MSGAEATAGDSTSMKNKTLNTGASVAQNLEPLENHCAHLHAYHVYAADPTRCVEANHYCAQVTEDVRQCLIYETPQKNARLIGIEYMITPRLYQTLPESERLLWHSHVYEVKSGMLVMPAGRGVPSPAWEMAEDKEMEQIIPLYGKTYHFWQVDRGDKVPMGAPELMGSFTSDETVKAAVPNGLEGLRKKTYDRFGISSADKEARRKGFCPGFTVHPDADKMWKK